MFYWSLSVSIHIFDSYAHYHWRLASNEADDEGMCLSRAEESCGIAGTRPEMESHLCKCKHSSAEEKLSILNNFACAQPLQLKTPRLQPQPQANPLPPVSHQLQEEPATPSPQTSPRLSPEKQQFLRALFLQGRLQTAQATNPMPAQPPILQPAQPPTGDVATKVSHMSNSVYLHITQHPRDSPCCAI